MNRQNNEATKNKGDKAMGERVGEGVVEQHYWDGKRCVFKFDLKEVSVGICRRDWGSLFQAEGPAAEKEREPAVESLVRGILRRRVSEDTCSSFFFKLLSI